MNELTAWSGPKLSRAHPLVKRLLAATFPDYTGRTIGLRLWDKPRQLDNYWDGGSRSYWRLVRIADGAIAELDSDNPLEPSAHVLFDLPEGVLAVEHRYSCGRDEGIRIYGRASASSLLTAGTKEER